MPVRAVALALALSLTLAACGARTAAPEPWPAQSSYFEETPVGSKTWTAVDAPPAWLTNPPAREGYVRVIGESASNLRRIATEKTWPYDAFAERIEAPLTPIVGADAAKRVTKIANGRAKPVARATSESDGPNPAVPGNHFVQAWTLWEIAIDDVVADLPAEQREAARAALAAPK